MKLLLDTHVLLWWTAGADRLATPAADAIRDPGNAALVSAASVWEIEIKRAKGLLTTPDDLLDQVAASDFDLLAIDARHATAAARLPAHHRDPFDRLLVAQAVAEGAALVTADRALAAYGVPILAAT